METCVELRTAYLSELPEVAGLWLAMMEELGKHRESDFAPGWRERFISYFQRRSATNEAAYFVAAEGNKVAGAAAGIISDGYPAVIHGMKNGYILGVYVLPPYRRRGYATALTRLAIDFLQAQGAGRIRLHASPFGRPIYERLGFVETGNEMVLVKPAP